MTRIMEIENRDSSRPDGMFRPKRYQSMGTLTGPGRHDTDTTALKLECSSGPMAPP